MITGDRDAKPIALTDSFTAGQPAPQTGGGGGCGKLTASPDLLSEKQELTTSVIGGRHLTSDYRTFEILRLNHSNQCHRLGLSADL